MRSLVLFLLLSATAMTDSPARDAVHTPAAGSAERAALLDAAHASVRAALAQPVRFVVERLRVDGDWGFLYAQMQREDGGAIDYAHTAFADAARAGMRSQDYAALLQRDGERWRVRTQAVGPTDPAWLAWPEQQGAPAALFDDAD